MPLLQPLGNNEVERLADRPILEVTEDALRAGVLKANDAITVGSDDRIRSREEQRMGKQIGKIHH
jgi:hypothetical protein